MFQQKRAYSKLIASLLLSLGFISINIGCSTQQAQTPGSTSTPTAKSAAPIESPKGPGAANLTATAQATGQPAACPTFRRGTPAITSGWQVYKDARFSFQFSFPPAWRAGVTTNTSADGSSSSYIVLVFPPTSHAPFDWHSSLFDAEHFEVTVFLTGSVTSLANDHSYIPESTDVVLGNTKSTLYDRTSSDCQEVERLVQSAYNHSQYQFRMKSLPEKAQQDITLFLGMLQSFKNSSTA
jgi:hypothetical protein